MISLLWLISSILLFLNNGVLGNHQNDGDKRITVECAWKTVRFDYPDPEAEVDALKSGEYTPKNILALDFDYHAPTDRYFLAMPPFRKGIPSTLGTMKRGESKVKPFPKLFHPNQQNRCQKDLPLSVFRVRIDKCGLLWVADTGVTNIFAATKLDCPLKLLAYDLNNMKDQQILSYEFPANVVTARSLLINILTESYLGDCSDTFAYITDVTDYGLIVFDYARKTSWRVKHKYFYIFPTAPTVMTNGVSFDFQDGLCGFALSPATDRERKLYFHSLSSVHESWVPVSVLKNSTVVKDPAVLQSTFSLSPGTRAGPTIVEVMTDDGILIYAVLSDNSLYCWNYRTPFVRENQHVIKRDDEKFQFISGLKLIGNRLLITSSRLQNYWYNLHNVTDVNYRLMIVDDVRRLLQSTPCTSTASNRAKDNSNEVSYVDPTYHTSYSPSASDRELWSLRRRLPPPHVLPFPHAIFPPHSWTGW